jgi:hypothetical protein
MKVKVVSDKQAEESDFVVCCADVAHSYFPDDVYGECFKCKTKIHFRPHAPKKPKKICMDCASKMGKHDIAVTGKIAREVNNFLTKN